MLEKDKKKIDLEYTCVKKIDLEITCVECGKKYTVSVYEDDYYEGFLFGEPIQFCFPYLSVADRELILSRTCEKCFDRIFKEE